MKRRLDDNDETHEQSTKRARFFDEGDGNTTTTTSDNTTNPIIDHATAHEARSSRGIRRMRGFEDHDKSILGKLEADNDTGFVQRVSGEEAYQDVESEKLVVGEDGETLIEPFTLERERQEGRFDADGNFLESTVLHNRQILSDKERKAKKAKHDLDALMKYDKKAPRQEKQRRSSNKSESDEEESDEDDHEKDAWLETLEDVERATALQKKSNQRRKLTQNNMRSKAIDSTPKLSEKELLCTLANHASTVLKCLEPGETVAQALARLRPNKKKQSKDDEENRSFQELNHACSQLLVLANDYTVFDEKSEHFESLERDYDESRYGKWWTYKWENGDPQQIYGPFSGRIMDQWYKLGHFAEHPILVKCVAVGKRPKQVDSANNALSKDNDDEDEDDMFSVDEDKPNPQPETDFVPLDSTTALL